jgi:hypothetical protein
MCVKTCGWAENGLAPSGFFATGRILVAQTGPEFSENWTGQARAGLRAHRYIDLHFPEILGIMEIRDYLHKLVAN